MLRRIHSAVRLAVSATVLTGSMIAFYESPFAGALPLVIDHEPESITRYRLQRLSTGVLVKEIRAAIAADEFSDAADLVRIGQELGHQIPPDVVASTVEPVADALWRNSTGFAQGFFYGEVNSIPSIFGAVAADYFVFGDVRDTYTEGGKLLVGDDYDRFTLGASLFGIAMLAPGTGAFDAGASVLKNANKARKLSSKLADRLVRSAGDAIDIGALKKGLTTMPAPMVSFSGLPRLTSAVSELTVDDARKLDFSKLEGAVKEAWPIDTYAIRRQFHGVLRSAALDELRIASSSISGIQRRAGIRSVFKVIERADSPAELRRFESLAKGMGDQTAGIIRLFGKGAIRLGDLLLEIVAAIALALGWLFGAAWTSLTFFLNFRRFLRSRTV
ncbi:transcriptional regulator [Sinorhizobium sp. BJ1]|uniref:transcriptional regulator n=1 Tax=Sinorhizobium sp. BJ1 TaxID=2035455 RepID=UPI000BE9C6D3|nr:transcriptional regulator [Sinorhizobium sp. BJ1]PDT82711.1 transcriptional regulator [Sinorhizobium sp. BJ1]